MKELEGPCTNSLYYPFLIIIFGFFNVPVLSQPTSSSATVILYETYINFISLEDGKYRPVLQDTLQIIYGPYILELKINGNIVNVTIRAPSFEEYLQITEKELSVAEESGAPQEYIEHLRKVLSNRTYALEEYNKSIKNYYNGTVGLVEATLTFQLDENNYAEGLGFFPLYSVKPLTPEFFEAVRPVYLGVPLQAQFGVRGELGGYEDYFCKFIAEGVLTRVFRIPDYLISGTDLTVLSFKYKYLVGGRNIVLPMNSTTYIYLSSVTPFNETYVSFLRSLPQCRVEEPGGRFAVEYLAVLAFVAVVVGVFLVRKR